MIKGKSIAWHYDACIEMWNEIAEYGYMYRGLTAMDKRYTPVCNCFACEVYAKDHRTLCHGCPFTIGAKKIPAACTYLPSPFAIWNHPNTGREKRKQYAIEIAQLFIDHYPGE